MARFRNPLALAVLGQDPATTEPGSLYVRDLLAQGGEYPLRVRRASSWQTLGVLHSGNGYPAMQAADGDWYLDRSNGRLYHRNLSSWELAYDPNVVVAKAVTTDEYTILHAGAGGSHDAGRVLEVDPDDGLAVVRVPSETTLPDGTIVGVYQNGPGKVAVLPESGSVVVRNAGKLVGPYAEATLRKRSSSEWVLAGAVEPLGYHEMVLTDRPFAYYRLEEESGIPQDTMGNHTPSSIGSGHAYRQPDIFGGNGSMTFDGQSRGIVIPHHSDFMSPSWTWELLYRSAPAPDGNILINANPNYQSGVQIWFYSNNGTYEVLAASAFDQQWGLKISAPYAEGEWQHLALTYDDTTQTFAFYVDGELAGTNSDGYTPKVGTASIEVMSEFDDWETGGGLDELAFYDYALTEDQIAAHYAAIANGP